MAIRWKVSVIHSNDRVEGGFVGRFWVCHLGCQVGWLFGQWPRHSRSYCWNPGKKLKRVSQFDLVAESISDLALETKDCWRVRSEWFMGHQDHLHASKSQSRIITDLATFQKACQLNLDRFQSVPRPSEQTSPFMLRFSDDRNVIVWVPTDLGWATATRHNGKNYPEVSPVSHLTIRRYLAYIGTQYLTSKETWLVKKNGNLGCAGARFRLFQLQLQCGEDQRHASDAAGMWIHCSINLVFGAEKKAFMAAADDHL